MKIRKRRNMSPGNSVMIWVVPLIGYSTLKYLSMHGSVSLKNEFVWWIGIPVSFIFWFLMNYSVTKSIKVKYTGKTKKPDVKKEEYKVKF